MRGQNGVGYACALALVTMACGGDGGRPSGASFGGTLTASASASAGEDSGETAGDTGGFDLGGGDSGPGETNGQCVSVSEKAMVGPQPADILVVVDNSGSMGVEAAAVQANMNFFSSQIFLANIDARVILISSYPINDDEGICVGQPLGSGGCPGVDNNPPMFTHIDDGVSSSNALEKILQHYDAYKGVLRQTAAKHILVVSDDNSSLGAQSFTQSFVTLGPGLIDFRFHAIVAPEDPFLACVAQTSCCGLAADIGEEYITLVNQTAGVFGNLCNQEFQPIFDELATQVVQQAVLACEYPIPPPPDGETFDADEVNVEFDDGAGGTLTIGRVDTPTDCANVMDGWYYDDPAAPTTIILCPQTCDQIQGFSQASVDIQFGCATIPAG